MATTTTLTIETYLGHFPKPDVEFIDGELKERPVVSSAHGLLQTLIGAWFFNHQNEWKVRAAVEVRTRVSPTRVRLPDVVVDHARKWPSVLVEPPLIVIEILSDEDTYVDTQRRAQDYQQMGIGNIWIIDPETRTGRYCLADAWVETVRFENGGTKVHIRSRTDQETVNPQLFTSNAWVETSRFEVQATGIHLELEWLFSELDRYDEESNS